MTREEWVDEVHTWEGTPFHHAGRVKGVGTDCVGIVIGAANALGVSIPEYANYSRQVSSDALIAETAKYMHRVCTLGHGTILILRVRHRAQHMAVYDATRNTIIHAFEQVGLVVENTFKRPFSNNVHSMWEVDFE